MQQFKQALRQDNPDLLLASLTLAQGIAHPDLDLVKVVTAVNALSEEAAQHIDRLQPHVDQIQELCEFLFVEKGFTGSQEDYYNPANSYLNMVLESKHGIPISLSTLLLIIADSLQIPAFGVSLPGHFIIGVNGPSRAYHFDPFNGGRPVTVTDCAALVQQITGHDGPFEPQWMLPVSVSTIVTRTLTNLHSIYLTKREWGNSQRVIQHLRVTVPEQIELWRDEAVVALHQNKMARAHHCLEKYLELAPNAPDAAILKKRMNPRLSEWVKLN